MHTCSWKRILVLASFLFLWVPLMVTPVLADCPDNVAVNPGFEHGFSTRDGIPEVSVANGWHPFWQEGPRQEEGLNHRPEFKPEDAAQFGYRRVRGGNWAQKMFTTYATHHAGVLQQINVPEGGVVSLSAWGQAWSSERDNPDESRDGKYYLSVGIDPTGGTNFTSENIVWSERSTVLDQWVQVAVEAQAQAGTVTVFLRGDAEWPVKHNDAYWDDVCVTYVAPTPPPTPIPPTNTPAPTDTTTPIPSPTVEPTATSSATPAMGTLSAMVFEDLDGDGQRDLEEPALSGARLELLDEEGVVVESHVTEDGDQPHTFTVAPGDYTVVETAPDGYRSTSPDRRAVTVISGDQVDVSFAEQPQPSSTPTETTEPSATIASPTVTGEAGGATPTPTDVPSPPFDMDGGLWTSLYGVSGILVAVLALVLPLGLYLWRSHR